MCCFSFFICPTGQIRVCKMRFVSTGEIRGKTLSGMQENNFLAYPAGISMWHTGARKCCLIPGGVRWLSCMISGCHFYVSFCDKRYELVSFRGAEPNNSWLQIRSVRMAERLALPTSDHRVAGSNPAGGEILPEPKRRFIAQSLSFSPFHRLEMTEILLKGRKTLTHPSIHHDCKLRYVM